MNWLTKKTILMTMTVGLLSFPLAAQDSLEEKIDRLLEKIDKQFDEIQDDLESAFSDSDTNEDDSIQNQREEMQSRVDELQSKLSELQNRETSRSKERELTRMTEELKELSKELEKEAKKTAKKANEIRTKTKRSKVKTYDSYFSGKSSVNKFGSTTTIEAEEKISGDVMVTSGDLIVKGEINGDAVAVSGDVVAKSGSKITGDAVAIGGKVVKEDGATILGKSNEISSDAETIDYGQRRSNRPNNPTRRIYSDNGIDWNERWIPNDFIDDKDGVQLRYNGVEGLYIGGGRLKDFHWDGEKSFSLYGFLGYAFSAKYLQFQVGYDRWFGNENRFELGFEVHNQTTTYDDWILGRKENSAAAFLIHENFFNFHKEKGGSFHVSQYITPSFKTTVAVKADNAESMGIWSDWALFGGKKKFNDNLAVSPGDIRALVVSASYDGVNEFYDSPSGIYLNASAEIAGGKLKGDYQYNIYEFEFRGYAHFSDYDNFRMRFKAAAGEDNVPIQKMFKLGGVGSLNGYRLFEYVGNRMMLANFEYILTGREIRRELPDLFDEFALLFFTDLGYVGNALASDGPINGFNMNDGNVKNSVGFGFTDDEGTKRLTFAWRTDVANEPVQVMFRWTRPF